ncbi:MAG TPA: GrpB family protein [Candidatus Paceibacterota bacterium]|nr:GrpB family protein [Candidatus Paceibacterota bacterium]
MRRTETIIEPSPEMTALQEKTLGELRALLPHSEIELVGASAVPMAGRPEIDLLVISKRIAEDAGVLVTNGYRQGPIVKETSFLKKMENEIEIAIQIMAPGNSMIEIHRKILRRLREDSQLRHRYEEWKRGLSGLAPDEYKKRKNEWLKENILGTL